MNSKKISVKTERFYSAHHALLRIAKDNLHKAETKEPGWFDCQFTAIALSALAIEAVCNAVGEKVIDKWCDFESCSPIVKIRLICEHLSINYDAGKEPWASVIWLCKTRNLIAHPKAEHIKNEAVITEQEHQTQEYRSIPKSKLEKKITFDYAKKSIATIEKLIDLFCEKLTVEQKFGIVGDMWHSSSKAHNVGS
ncbi:MAG: hypothetical protein ABIP37_03210 [Methylotenera sp.]